MRRFRAIVQTLKEPEDKELLWIKNDSIYYYDSGQWKPLKQAETTQSLSNLSVEVKYQDLVSLRDAKSLIPGFHYRITDYVCTTTQTGTAATDSVQNRFDIIVEATSKGTLSDEASLIANQSNNSRVHLYFESFKVKYALDNNPSRFGWADQTDGKGVIYYMQDANGNEAPYDFKHIVFQRYKGQGGFGTSLASALGISKLTEGRLFPRDFPIRQFDSFTGVIYATLANPLWFYTFHLGEGLTDQELTDETINRECSFSPFINNNRIEPTVNSIRCLPELNDIVIHCIDNRNMRCQCNIFHSGCSSITLPGNSAGSIFESDTNNIVIGGTLTNSTFKRGCNTIIVFDTVNASAFGSQSEIQLYTSIYYSTIGDGAAMIAQATLGVHNSPAMSQSIIGPICSNIKLLGDLDSCKIGAEATNITFTGSSNSVVIGEGSSNITCEDVFSSDIQNSNRITLSRCQSVTVRNADVVSITGSGYLTISNCNNITANPCKYIDLEGSKDISLVDVQMSSVVHSNAISISTAENVHVEYSDGVTMGSDQSYNKIRVLNANNLSLQQFAPSATIQNLVILGWNGEEQGSELKLKDTGFVESCPYCQICLSEDSIVPLSSIRHT